MNFLKKIFGLDKLEAKLEEAAKAIQASEQRAEEAIQIAKLSERKMEEERLVREEQKLSPKEIATRKGEPWVAVLDTHINKDNIRNGFFELDWNEQFVLQLKQTGYGFDGDPDEEIVDRWFRDLARNMLVEDGQDPTRGAGFINVVPISKRNSEIS